MKPPAPDRLPQHIAIIMDGNGRWAKQRGMARIEGHRAGADSVDTITRACVRDGITHLTLYAFSTENWHRPRSETNALMRLLQNFLDKKTPQMVEEKIRFDTIGDIAALPEKVRKKIATAKEKTAACDRLHLTLALNYGARDEIVRATRKIAAAAAAGEITTADIDEKLFSAHLDTAGTPDPDLLIRTSGELRLSNYLLWQLSYAEIYVTDTLWPDFREADFAAALADYTRRDRRFGKS